MISNLKLLVGLFRGGLGVGFLLVASSCDDQREASSKFVNIQFRTDYETVEKVIGAKLYLMETLHEPDPTDLDDSSEVYYTSRLFYIDEPDAQIDVRYGFGKEKKLNFIAVNRRPLGTTSEKEIEELNNFILERYRRHETVKRE